MRRRPANRKSPRFLGTGVKPCFRAVAASGRWMAGSGRAAMAQSRPQWSAVRASIGNLLSRLRLRRVVFEPVDEGRLAAAFRQHLDPFAQFSRRQRRPQIIGRASSTRPSFSQAPTHPLVRERGQQHRHMEPAFAGRLFRDVADIDPIRRSQLKLPIGVLGRRQDVLAGLSGPTAREAAAVPRRDARTSPIPDPPAASRGTAAPRRIGCVR